MPEDSDEKNNPDEYRLTVRLDLDTHDKWDSFISENPAVNSKSGLVRKSVSEYIRREEEKEEGELTKEQKQIIDVIRNENGRVLSLAEDLAETLEEMENNQITGPEHQQLSYEAIAEANQRQTTTILTRLDDFSKGDSE